MITVHLSTYGSKVHAAARLVQGEHTRSLCNALRPRTDGRWANVTMRNAPAVDCARCVKLLVTDVASSWDAAHEEQARRTPCAQCGSPHDNPRHHSVEGHPFVEAAPEEIDRDAVVVPEHAKHVTAHRPAGSDWDVELGRMWQHPDATWSAVDHYGVLVADRVTEREAMRAMHHAAGLPYQDERPAAGSSLEQRLSLTPEEITVLRDIVAGRAVYLGDVVPLRQRALVTLCLGRPVVTDLGRRALGVVESGVLRADDERLDRLGSRGPGLVDLSTLDRLDALLLAWAREIDAQPTAVVVPPENSVMIRTTAVMVRVPGDHESRDLGWLCRYDDGTWSALTTEGVVIIDHTDEMNARRVLHLGYAAMITLGEQQGDTTTPVVDTSSEVRECAGNAVVEPMDDYESGTLAVAVCDCLWTGPRRRDADRAQADANLHNAAARPVTGPYTADQLVSIGGRRWDSLDGRHHRVYVDWEEAAGLHLAYYNSGNVRSARLAGEGIISNQRARRLLAAGRAYLDVATGQLVTNLADVLGTTYERALLDHVAREVVAAHDRD